MHTGLPVLGVRLAILGLVAVRGTGLLLYLALWAVVPPEPGGDGRRDLRQLAPFAIAGAGLVGLVAWYGLGEVNLYAGWLVAVVVVGAGLIWRQAGPEWWPRWRPPIGAVPWLDALLEQAGRRASLLRFGGGVVLVAAGVIGLVAVYVPAAASGLSSVRYGVVFSVLALGGVLLVAGPVIWRTFEQLRAEREGRIREQERAELAAIVHDQVLHTLALIQRNAADPQQVQRLARGQERSLRGWLYQPTGSPSTQLVAALEQVAAEVEDTYAVTVETVAVGDRAVDEAVAALVAAAREAVVNAARHAQVTAVSVYAEVEPQQISVFVRDRGVGFDLDGIDESRHGVHGSIIGRMARHGGRAEIRAAPGEGTEVRLTMPVRASGPAVTESTGV
ncbi:ATP-binding protein [Pilimelia columellifera subsp. columellifera]|uniref:ATP-binding protein n=1 Tax=Pilimelia columellifera subsp. columellifera TaxID=706583 RepID=A0ABP6AX42_9ACTN